MRVLPAEADPVLGLAQTELAHAALTIAALGAGETVVVSSAAGSIGSVAGTLARRLGAGRVVGSVSEPVRPRALKGVPESIEGVEAELRDAPAVVQRDGVHGSC
ncbi:hypothetical protein [Nonomuraea sp. LPB2021202275-12-8]|uniref:hypothetical protein n=1 Tax=Nonomuraea sp. LPB2021202275-12-8 TaxID=3120159 RepID=UPI00300CE4C4